MDTFKSLFNKYWLVALGLACLLALLLFSQCTYNVGISEEQIKKAARRSSVQPVFHTPILRVKFREPLPEKKGLTQKDINDLLKEKEEAFEKKIEDAIEKLKKEQAEERHGIWPTDCEKWGVEVISNTFVALPALAPKDAKIPERIIVVAETEKKEIDPYDEEYKDDVRTLSETVDVSLPKARELLNNIKAKGYTISKEEIKESSEIKLLWFKGGWDETYPTTLDWKVCLEGEENNLIIGYDSRGILEIKPIPDYKRVYVKFSYLPLKDQFKPKPYRELELEKEIEELKEQLEDVQEELEKLTEKAEPYKRNIEHVTWLDVIRGYVTVERMWMMSWGSGVFLGNLNVRDEVDGRTMAFVKYQDYQQKSVGVILTNAHVVKPVLTKQTIISEDKEQMWIVYPAHPFIRYTQHSSQLGSPAELLYIHDMPVFSPDFDCAIMTTASVPEFERHKAILGNSDNVENGTKVVRCSNPSVTQKFISEGIVSNTNFNMLNSLMGNWFAKHSKNLTTLQNASFWVDTPIGTGGISGSGIIALDGPEKSRVVALQNSGLGYHFRFTALSEVDKETQESFYSYSKIKDTADEYKSRFFKDDGYKTAIYGLSTDDELGFDSKKLLETAGFSIMISGMSAGIPINKVKAYLQERGLDPQLFGSAGVPVDYWEK